MRMTTHSPRPAQELTLYFPQTGKSYDVNPRRPLVAGTSETCTLTLSRYFKGNTRIISRRHFQILYHQDEGYTIEDLRSLNGTWLNDVQLQPRVPVFLRDGDRIILANHPDFTIEVILGGDIHTTEPLLPWQAQPTAQAPPKPGGMLRGIYYDAMADQFIVDGQRVDPETFSKIEHKALRYLAMQPGRVRTYDELAFHVWNGWVQNNTIAKTIGNIRRKLDAISPGAGNYIQTIRGRGFRCKIV